MNSDAPCVLAVNGGSSSIKFALFKSNDSFPLVKAGKIEGVGLRQGKFAVQGPDDKDGCSWPVSASDPLAAAGLLMDWIQEQIKSCELVAIGHRIVHGGPNYWQPQRVTPEMIAELRKLSPFDPEHLPEEILLMEQIHRRFPDLPQVACFDTAFHHDMPRVATMLPIPRRYEANGVRRYGFHGLSYSFLLQELERVAGLEAANGRVILAHLGNGASLAAVRNRTSIDTTMAFTPAAGLVMSTRSGDIDPGLPSFLARSEGMAPSRFDHLINHESGLLGISETSSDMRDLLKQEAADKRAAEAIDLFCYQAKKWIGAYAAVLEGLDTLVFAGGIGENAPPVRARICGGLGFLGMELDPSRNEAQVDVISTEGSRCVVRIIRTNEELMIARSVGQVLGLSKN